MSRPRSAPAKPAKPAKPVKGKATPARGGGARSAGRPGVFVTTPKSDIYVALLGVALGSMILAVLLLVLLMGKYDFKIAAV